MSYQMNAITLTWKILIPYSNIHDLFSRNVETYLRISRCNAKNEKFPQMMGSKACQLIALFQGCKIYHRQNGGPTEFLPSNPSV